MEGNAAGADGRRDDQDSPAGAEDAEGIAGAEGAVGLPSLGRFDLDPDDFEISSYDVVEIEMPRKQVATDEDVDAQLFGFAVSQRGSAAMGIDELDDAWVRETFGEQAGTIAQLREHIAHDLNRRFDQAYQEIVYERCADALIGRLSGGISEDALAAAVEQAGPGYEGRLAQMGMTKAQYLREEGISEEEFERRLSDDVRRQLLLNVALDKMIGVSGATVATGELTEYLACDDPQSFVEELKAKGLVEQARRAATRVKVMRRVVETARIAHP